MHPILFKIGSFEVPTYGTILVIAFLLSIWLLKREAKHVGLSPEKATDTALVGLLFGLVGAKLLLILVDLPYYFENPGEIVGTLRSAGVIYGGLILGAVGVIWSIRRKQLPLLSTLDLMAPFTALGLGLGRLSCLMSGCCYGIPYEGLFSLHFPDHPICEAPSGLGLFPIQPLGFLNGVILFVFLYWLLRNKRFDGQVILAFFMLYSLTRGLLEFLRGDAVRGLWFGETVSTSQLIALVGITISTVLYLRLYRRPVVEAK